MAVIHNDGAHDPRVVLIGTALRTFMCVLTSFTVSVLLDTFGSPVARSLGAGLLAGLLCALLLEIQARR